MLDTNWKGQEVAHSCIHSFICSFVHFNVEVIVLESECLSFHASSKWVNLGYIFNPICALVSLSMKSK